MKKSKILNEQKNQGSGWVFLNTYMHVLATISSKGEFDFFLLMFSAI